jgi:hypothetical protein
MLDRIELSLVLECLLLIWQIKFSVSTALLLSMKSRAVLERDISIRV